MKLYSRGFPTMWKFGVLEVTTVRLTLITDATQGYHPEVYNCTSFALDLLEEMGYE